jgi:4-hydroxy-tetrahydrodipicolinate synthase
MNLKSDWGMSIWSATPTPFTALGRIDVTSLKRTIDHHVALKVSGVMVAGTCGEGPWMRESDREVLVRSAVEAANGRLTIAFQVTDNSSTRVLENIEKAAEWGADLAVVAAPLFMLNATIPRLVRHYLDIAARSPLPLCLYDRGKASPYVVPKEAIEETVSDPKYILVKDSSQLPERMASYLKARASRPGLSLFSGSEFDCVDYIEGGYDGLLLGGGVFNAMLARKIAEAVKRGDCPGAQVLQARMNDLMYRVYGGSKIECWMTGLKDLLVEMGLFSTNVSLLEYPMTEICRSQIRAAVSGADGLGFRDDLIPKGGI